MLHATALSLDLESPVNNVIVSEHRDLSTGSHRRMAAARVVWQCATWVQLPGGREMCSDSSKHKAAILISQCTNNAPAGGLAWSGAAGVGGALSLDTAPCLHHHHPANASLMMPWCLLSLSELRTRASVWEKEIGVK